MTQLEIISEMSQWLEGKVQQGWGAMIHDQGGGLRRGGWLHPHRTSVTDDAKIDTFFFPHFYYPLLLPDVDVRYSEDGPMVWSLSGAAQWGKARPGAAENCVSGLLY